MFQIVSSLRCLFLQIWNLKPGWGSRPDVHVEKAHADDITAVKFSSDGRILLSRSFDGSLKVDICIHLCLIVEDVCYCGIFVQFARHRTNLSCIRSGICAR